MKKLITLIIPILLFSCVNEVKDATSEKSKNELSKEAQAEIDLIDNLWGEVLDSQSDDDFAFTMATSDLTLAIVKLETKEGSAYGNEFFDKIDSLRTLRKTSQHQALKDFAKERGWNNINEEQVKKIESTFRKGGDEFSDHQFYHCKSSSKYVNTNGFWLYYSKDDLVLGPLRLRVQYLADDWLFVKNLQILANENKYTLFGDWDNDHSYGEIYEWYDEIIEKDQWEIVFDIIRSNGAKLKFNGRQYNDKRTVSSKQAKEMEDILKVYYFYTINEEDNR